MKAEPANRLNAAKLQASWDRATETAVPILLCLVLQTVTWIIGRHLNFFNIDVAAVSFLYLYYCHNVRELLRLTALSAVFVALASVVFPMNALLAVVATGCASLALLAIRGGDDRNARTAVYLAVANMGSAFLVCVPGLLSSRLTYDAVLLAWDGALGLQPSFVLGRLLSGHSWLHELCVFFYIALGISILASLNSRIREGTAWYVAAKFLVASVVGFACFTLVPATGPLFAFPSYPFHVPPFSRQLMGISPNFLRNCAPSLHFASAVLAFTNSRGRARILCAVFVVFTLLATLGLGEHYLFDLVLSAPLCAFVELLFRRRLIRASIALTGVVAPLVIVQHRIVPGGMPEWLWIVATIAISWLLVRLGTGPFRALEAFARRRCDPGAKIHVPLQLPCSVRGPGSPSVAERRMQNVTHTAPDKTKPSQ